MMENFYHGQKKHHKTIFAMVSDIIMDAVAELEQSQGVETESDQLVNICSFAIHCDRWWPSTQ